MILAEYYQPIFLFVVTVLSIFCYFKYNGNSTIIIGTKWQALILAICFAIFIGSRPIYTLVFGDTQGYALYHDSILNKNFTFSWDAENFLFDNYGGWIASLGIDHVGYFIGIALFYFIIRYLSCVKLFPDNSYLAFLVFCGSFLTFTSAVNGLKAGIASSFFALAVAYRNEWKKAAVCLFITLGFHHAFILNILVYTICFFYKNTKYYIYIWMAALLVAILHVNYFQNLFAGFADERGAEYLIGAGGYHTGMRYDFVIYSVMPIIIGWRMIFKHDFNDTVYTFILNTYILLNAVWLLCMYASFTNRIAALSWCLYPIIILYPFLSKDLRWSVVRKNSAAAVALMINLSFTLFMQIIYYSILKG